MERILWNIPVHAPGTDQVPVPAYLTLLILAFLAGLFLVRRKALVSGVSKDRVTDLWVGLLVFGLLGARIAHVLFDGSLGEYVDRCVHPEKVAQNAPVCTSDRNCPKPGDRCLSGHCLRNDCLAPFRFWEGGLTFYGGLALALAFAYSFAVRYRLAWRALADAAAPALALGLAVGRIGCFLNGCCFGQASHLPWAVSFPPDSLPSWHQAAEGVIPTPYQSSLPVHPTQLYSVLTNLALFAYLELRSWPRKATHGVVMADFLIFYAVGRFLVEFFRADPRGGLGPLSTSQLIGLAAMGLGLAWKIRLRRSPRPADGVADREAHHAP